ncbi:hypothetical protein CPB85DRAFT_1567460 [Mucidula mucida]|nr:hypothetical protein CPB85DRAFT_1567460 [Mucidula mucida]
MRDAKRATQPPPIYVFDVYTLGKDRLRPILDLLKCPSVSKIFYDSRIDAAALYHEYNLNIVNDLDLQLAEVLSRDEGDAERMRARLEERRTSFLDWEESVVDHTKWLERPVAPKSLDYAAKDVRLMSLLHDHFTREKLLPRKLAAISQRYIALGTEASPVKGSDIFRSNALLPMGILDHTSGEKRDCQGCRRLLGIGCFSPGGGGYCRACNIMSRRRPRQKKTKQK